MSEEVYRVGYQIHVTENLARLLGTYARQLLTLHGRLEQLKRDFAKVDAEALQGMGKQAEKMARYLGAARQTVSVQQELAKVAKLNAETDGKRSLLAEKVKTEQGKTLLLQQRAAHDAEAHASRMLTTAERHRALQRRAETEAQSAAVRLQSAQLRLAELQERRARATHQQTADEARILDLTSRMQAFADPGNRIGTGLAIARGGFGVVRSIAALGHDHDVQHSLREQMSLEQMNLGAKGTAQAMAAAERVRRMVGGLDVAGSIDIVKDLINVTGHVEEATNDRLLRRFAQFNVSNRVAYGLTRGQSYNAIKAAELMMPNREGMSDEERMEGVLSKLELVNKIMAGTGGKVGPNEILNFIKTANSARMGLSEQGLMKLVPVIQEMGGPRAGTGVMSVLQNLANGRASHASLANLMDLGLINTHAMMRDVKTGKMVNRTMIEEDKNGRVKRMLPGAIVDDQLLRTDPVAWFSKNILPKTKGMNNAEIDRLVNSIMGNRVAAGMGATFLTQIQRIMKDKAIIEHARGIEATDSAQQDNYLRAELNYQEALKTLREKMAVSTLPTLTLFIKAFTKGLDGLSAFLHDHPVLAKLGMGGAAVGSTAVGVGGLALAASGAWGVAKRLGPSLLGLGGEAGGAPLTLGGAVGMRLGALLAPLAEAGVAVAAGLTAPILAGIAAIAAAIAGGVLAWKTNFMGFRDVARGAGHAVHHAWVGVTNGLKKAIGGAVDWMKAKFSQLTSSLVGFYNGLPPAVRNAIEAATGVTAVKWAIDTTKWAGNAIGGMNQQAQAAAKKWADEQEKADKDPSGQPTKVEQHFHGDHHHHYPKGTDGHTAHKTMRRKLATTGRARSPGLTAAPAY